MPVGTIQTVTPVAGSTQVTGGGVPRDVPLSFVSRRNYVPQTSRRSVFQVLVMAMGCSLWITFTFTENSFEWRRGVPTAVDISATVMDHFLEQ